MALDLDHGKARMKATDLHVRDFFNIPNALLHLKKPVSVPATVSFDIRWSGVTRRVKVRDEKNGFAGNFIENTATIEWSAKEKGFSFKSDAAKTSTSVSAVIGHERNGVFFDKDGEGDDDDGD